MNIMDKSNYFPINKDNHQSVQHIFNYLENYLRQHDEKDMVDMDFIIDINVFFDSILVPIYFSGEEHVLFKELSHLSISESIQHQIDQIKSSHQSIASFVFDMALLINKYSLGYISSLDEIHAMMGALVKSFKELTLQQDKLFPEIDQLLSVAQKEKLGRDFLKFNEGAIKKLTHDSILEKYKKYNTLPA